MTPTPRPLLRHLESFSSKDLLRLCALSGAIIQRRTKARHNAARQALEPKPLTPTQIYHQWRTRDGISKSRKRSQKVAQAV